jgi:hypothetical protein
VVNNVLIFEGSYAARARILIKNKLSTRITVYTPNDEREKNSYQAHANSHHPATTHFRAQLLLLVDAHIALSSAAPNPHIFLHPAQWSNSSTRMLTSAPRNHHTRSTSHTDQLWQETPRIASWGTCRSTTCTQPLTPDQVAQRNTHNIPRLL